MRVRPVCRLAPQLDERINRRPADITIAQPCPFPYSTCIEKATPMAKPTPLPILRGNLEVLVLKALTAGPLHGYAITDWLEHQAHGNLELVDSALYQALYRLESRRLVKPVWGVTEKNRRARFYHITDAGRAELRAEAARWTRYAATIGDILALPVPATGSANG